MKISTKKILFLLMLAFVLACVPKPSPPTNAVEEDKMAKILADIHLAESKVNRMNLQNYDSSRVAYKEFERRILKKYDVDSVRYHKTYDFYAMNPSLMIQLYDETIKILEEQKKKGKLE